MGLQRGQAIPRASKASRLAVGSGRSGVGNRWNVVCCAAVSQGQRPHGGRVVYLAQRVE
jgi:hypothetical protein